MTESLAEFWRSVPFEPDEFQVEAASAVAAGQSVLVTAPTGSGKTLVAEAAIHITTSEGKRAFYTAPIKALSNQKFADLTDVYGPTRVGLMTGDNVVNPGAEIIVMTTEVLRNMIYADIDRLGDVGVVILDEVHYLQDRSRGSVWEEVIIHCPPDVILVCLSATVSNNHEFASWVRERRGPTRLVATDHRPVPLESMYMMKDKVGSHRVYMHPTFAKKGEAKKLNPKILQQLALDKGRRRRWKTPNRLEVVEKLQEAELLPAIYFIFSRAGCESAASRLATAGLRLTTPEERTTIRQRAEANVEHLSDADLDMLGYESWMLGLEAGVGAHHAGLVPAFKETVEQLFESGLIKVVFATETLSLGINMPAKTVVLESLSKFNGESHQPLRPGDYTQLTGRAGRRGIDTKGYGVVLHSPYTRFDQVAAIAAAGSHELRSSFRPTYNMAVNVIANYQREQAEVLLRASFGSYQINSSVSQESTEAIGLRKRILQAEAEAVCHLEADISNAHLRPKRDAHPEGLDHLEPGQVVDINGGSRDGRYVVLRRLKGSDSDSDYSVLSTSGRVSKLGTDDLRGGFITSGRIRIPPNIHPKNRKSIQNTLRVLRRLPRAVSVPVPGGSPHQSRIGACPDIAQHLAAEKKLQRLRNRLSKLEQSPGGSGKDLVAQFQKIVSILEHLDYLDGWTLTARGRRLRSVYNESELLVTESVENGALYGLDPAQLSALVSCFVYEPRSDSESKIQWPNQILEQRWVDILGLWDEIVELEKMEGLPPTRKPDPGFVPLAFAWASGVEFEDLSLGSMAPGDFVRVARQIADLLRQLRDSAQELAEPASVALKQVDRGVVAAQGVGQ